MPKDRPDYISVRLSDHAIDKLGGDAAVGVNSGHMQYMFHGAKPVEILRRPEWEMLQHDQFDGQALFQEDTSAAAASTAVQPVAQPAAHQIDATDHEG